MVPVKDRRRGGVEQRSVPVWLFPRVSFRPFSPDLNKECHGCTAWKILTTGDIRGLAAASPEGAEDIRQAAAPRGFPWAVSDIWTAAITGEQLLLAITVGSLLSPNLGSKQKCLLMGCSIVHPQLFSMVVHCLWCCLNPPASPNNTSHNPGVSGASRLGETDPTQPSSICGKVFVQ